MDFAEIRLETPPQEVFMPPDGFTPYANSIALMNELIVRDANFARKHQLDESTEPVDQSGSYHPMPGVGGVGHP